MDLSSLVTLLTDLVSGGPASVILILLVVIGGLLWELLRNQKLLSAKEEKIDKIIENYHSGILGAADALHRVEAVIQDVKFLVVNNHNK